MDEIKDNDVELEKEEISHHDHKHSHVHEHEKAVLNRMSRAIGHMNAIKKMIESGRDCSDVLIQLSAVKSEIQNVSKVIMKDHISTCITEAVKNNDNETIEKLNGAIDKLL